MVGVEATTSSVQTQDFSISRMSNICQETLVAEDIIGRLTVEENPVRINVSFVTLIHENTADARTYLSDSSFRVAGSAGVVVGERSALFISSDRTLRGFMSLESTSMARDMRHKCAIPFGPKEFDRLLSL